jgi:hypothetical protein
MHFQQYLLSCHLLQDAYLPPYKGSTFRGAFGVALKQTVCAQRRQSCHECLLQDTCVYARVFEPKPVEGRDARFATLPHPYVIQPPSSAERSIKAGNQLDFSFLLFGDFNHQLPYFIYAFQKMGELGIGKGKAKFELIKVSCAQQILYRHGDKKLKMPESLQLLEIPTEKPSAVSDLVLRFHTPLRVKHRGSFVRRLDFATLTRTALRRFSTLLEAYGGGEPDLPYRELVHQAQLVEVAEDNSRWHDWQRYSNRQQESMQFGGLLGEIIYRDVPVEHQRLLQAIAPLHLGKQTSFGLGQIEVVQC